LFLGFGGIGDDEMEKGIALLKKAWISDGSKTPFPNEASELSR
jgi:hypothetical protein